MMQMIVRAFLFHFSSFKKICLCEVILGAGSRSEAKDLRVGAEWTNEHHSRRKWA